MSTQLIPEQRQQEVLRLLRSAGVLAIRSLTETLGVSHMTVRRDIAALEAAGQVVSVQGGVRLSDWSGVEPPRQRASRAQLEIPRKRAIGEHAAALVVDDSTVFLDAGTTCEAVAPFLGQRQGLTVVTNDFFVVNLLLDIPDVAVIHTGGAVDRDSGSSSGALAAATVANLTIDLFFMSTGTWDIARGVTTPDLDKLILKRAVMEAADRTFLVADSTKYGTVERFRVTALDELDGVVTDTGLSVARRDRITELGVEVHAAPF